MGSDAVTRCVLSCSVTSSEKVDKAQRYADFTLLSIPYPGRGSFQGPVRGQASQDWGSEGHLAGPGHLGAQVPWSSLVAYTVAQCRTVWFPVHGSQLRVGHCHGRGLPWEGPRDGVWTHTHPAAPLSEFLHRASPRFSQASWKSVRLSSGSCRIR